MHIKKTLLTILITIATATMSHATPVRIKDVVAVEGVRDNILVGYGLVVGLNGTGDNLTNAAFTQKGLTDFLEKLGVNTRGANLKTKNIAAVTVTATLPPFARQGNKIDISVSTLGDAKSLQGGTLLATPLVGADGAVYAVGQGQVSLGGFTASGKSGTTVSKGVSTNGFVSNGAIVEKEVSFDFNSMQKIRLALRNPDITTALEISDVINHHLGNNVATASDPGTVMIKLSDDERADIVRFLSKIEQLTIEPDLIAKILIDEASGTIVMGNNVRISPVAISQGNLTITITESSEVSQPGAFAPQQAQTVTAPSSTVNVDQGSDKKMVVLRDGTTLQELVNGLNALGVGPRDLISILESIKAAGALQASIEIR